MYVDEDMKSKIQKGNIRKDRALEKENTSSHRIIALQDITKLEAAGHTEAPSLCNYFSRNSAKK